MDIPTSTKSIPEIKLVKLIAFGEDNSDLIFATKSIIKIFPIIGTEKERTEIRQTSTSPINSKLKKPGRSVIQKSDALGFAVTAMKPA